MRNPNGYGSVYKMKGNRRKPYIATVTDGFEIKNGKCVQKRRSIGYFATRKEALMCLAEFNKQPYNPSKATFCDIYMKWSEEKYKTISPKTAEQYEIAYRRLESIHNMRITDIDRMECQKAINIAQVKESQMNITRIVIKNILVYANDNGYATINTEFVSKLQSNGESVKVERDVFTKAQIEECWQKYKEDHRYGYVLMLLYTGLRAMEFVSMKKEHIHDDYIEVTESKTEAGIRIVPICPQIAQIYDFMMQTGKYPLRGKTSEYRQIRDFIKSRFGRLTHDTRHTFITRLVEMEKDERIVKIIVGHATQDVTSIYTHISKEKLIAAMEDFGYGCDRYL